MKLRGRVSQKVLGLLCSAFMPLGAQEMMRLGVDNLTREFMVSLGFAKERPIRVGLITNRSAVDHNKVPTYQKLIDMKETFSVAYLFAPEHGLEGVIPASETVPTSFHEKTGIPLISLYKKGSGSLISPELLSQLDLLIFDIQDSGVRHYTYISTLYQTLAVVCSAHIPLVILDRPNPLGGGMEGPLVEDGLRSFISIAPIPLRHGMTMGELALFFNKHMFESRARVHVVPMTHYHRFQETSAVASYELSPNIMSRAACLGYSFLGLLGEVRPFDMKVGSTEAFQSLACPLSIGVSQQVWRSMQEEFEKAGIKTTAHTYNCPRKQKEMHGLLFDIHNVSRIPLFELQMKVLRLFSAHKINLRLSEGFDKAVGTYAIRHCIEKGCDWSITLQKIKEELQHFYQKAHTLFLYEPFPVIL